MVFYFLFESHHPRIPWTSKDNPEGYTYSAMHMLMLHQGKRPVFLHTPEPVRRVIEWCWSHEPSERPSADELADVVSALPLRGSSRTPLAAAKQVLRTGKKAPM